MAMYRVKRIDSGPSTLSPSNIRLKVTIYNAEGVDEHNTYLELSPSEASDPGIILGYVAEVFEAYTPNDFTP